MHLCVDKQPLNKINVFVHLSYLCVQKEVVAQASIELTNALNCGSTVLHLMPVKPGWLKLRQKREHSPRALLASVDCL